jgi:ribosomal protein S12 methylthiotransferase accessory factor
MQIKAKTVINAESFVQTEIDGFQIITEAPVSAGGTGRYPPATRLVIASLLNCSFSDVKAFLLARGIPVDGLEMEFAGTFEEGIYKEMEFILTLPRDFPEKYLNAVEKAIDACTVKKIMKNLPDIKLNIQEQKSIKEELK